MSVIAIPVKILFPILMKEESSNASVCRDILERTARLILMNVPQIHVKSTEYALIALMPIIVLVSMDLEEPTARLTLMIVHPILDTIGEFVTMMEVPLPAIVPKDLLELDVKGTSMTVRTTIV